MKFKPFSFVKNVCMPAFAIIGATSAHAADKELLDILLGNGAINQTQYEALLKKEELTKADAAVIKFANGSGLNIRSGDGRYEVEIGGRLHLDYVDHSYDSAMGADPISGSQVRRGRIELDGMFAENWEWAAEFDYAKNGVAIKDFKLGYEFANGIKVLAGHQKQPYSLSLEMSSNDIPFVERSVDNYLVAALTDRAIGIRGEASGEHWFVAAGLFGDTLKTGAQGDEGWGTSARFVYSPVIADKAVVHLGIRGSYREIKPSTTPLSFKDKTTDFSGFSIVNTGTLANAETASLFGPEFAVSFGPLFVFGEQSEAEIDRLADSTLNFSSWHVAAAWALTGESHATRYKMSDGEFKNIRPSRPFDPKTGGMGALELAVRYAGIDLNDGNVTGGEEEAVSFAVNWYPNNNIRFMADWTRIVDTDESNLIRQFAPDMDIFTLRTQYNF